MTDQKICWLDLGCGDVGLWYTPHSIHERWQDHGMGLLLTIAKQRGYNIDVISLPKLHSWAELRMAAKKYDVICMNVRSWRYRFAKKAAEIIKSANPHVQIWCGGMHATVAPHEMLEVPEFDIIVSREAEGTFLDLLENGGSSARFIQGRVGAFENMDDLPFIDRDLWVKPPGEVNTLESPGGWGPGTRAATMVTSRMCPWHCSFCYPAERNHFSRPRRRSVTHVLEELQYIDAKWGPITTVVYHDSEFLMHAPWIDEYIDRYPRETGNWHFWASVRADMMAKWPERVEALIKDCNWHTLSIGLESGSDKVLKIMNKETTVDLNMQGIELVNRLSSELEAQGKHPPVIFANIMFGVPGEEREDAFQTMRMLGHIRRCIPSIALFTPYPGSTLGDRVIAAGLSLDTHKHYDRFPTEAKMKGIDYQFYQDLFNGKYDKEVGFSVPYLMSFQGAAAEALA